MGTLDPFTYYFRAIATPSPYPRTHLTPFKTLMSPKKSRSRGKEMELFRAAAEDSISHEMAALKLAALEEIPEHVQKKLLETLVVVLVTHLKGFGKRVRSGDPLRTIYKDLKKD